MGYNDNKPAQPITYSDENLDYLYTSTVRKTLNRCMNEMGSLDPPSKLQISEWEYKALKYGLKEYKLYYPGDKIEKLFGIDIEVV